MNTSEALTVYNTYVAGDHAKLMDRERLERVLNEAYPHLSLARRKKVDKLLNRETVIPKKKKKLRTKWIPKPPNTSATKAIARLIESLSKKQKVDRRWTGDNVIALSLTLYKVVQEELTAKHWNNDNGVNLYRSYPYTCEQCTKTSIWNNATWCARGCGTSTMIQGQYSIYAEHKATGIKALLVSITEDTDDKEYIAFVED